MNAFTFSFGLLQILGFALVAFRLYRLQLTSTFRWFFSLCLFELIRLGIATRIERGTDAFGYYYFTTQPIIWVLYICITLELFREAFAGHPAIYTVSRKALTISVAFAVLVAVLTLGIDFRQPDGPNKTLELFLLVERTVFLSLLVFVIALMSLLSWFPVPLSRNVLAHAVIFSFFFAVKTAMLFTRNLFGVSFTRSANVGLLAALVVCLLLWCLLLQPKQDARIVRSGLPRDPEAEARLMEQLNAINQTLAGSARK